MKNKYLEKKYKGDDLVFAKKIRNLIKSGKLMRWMDYGKPKFGRFNHSRPPKQLCMIDMMVTGRD